AHAKNDHESHKSMISKIKDETRGNLTALLGARQVTQLTVRVTPGDANCHFEHLGGGVYVKGGAPAGSPQSSPSFFTR
ncbi:MAG: hypothetical protein AAGD86_04080, partial [Pseudomonadota bacterium]